MKFNLEFCGGNLQLLQVYKNFSSSTVVVKRFPTLIYSVSNALLLSLIKHSQEYMPSAALRSQQ